MEGNSIILIYEKPYTFRLTFILRGCKLAY
jgi:hypothetical protein